MADVTRRSFVSQLVWTSLGAQLLLPLGCHRRERVDAAPRARELFFSAAHTAILAAACEAILPRDSDPGALDLAVPAYIDGVFARAELQAWEQPFLRGLHALDEAATARLGHGFAAATAAQQQGVLAELASDHKQHAFFEQLVRLTLEGAFGDPRWGGNRDRQGWHMLGFAPDPCA